MSAMNKPTNVAGVHSRQALRILFLRPELNRYGVTKSMMYLAQGLIGLGHVVTCTSESESDMAREWTSLGATHFSLPLKSARRSLLSLLRIIAGLRRVVKREGVQIIHSHHRWTTFVASLLKRVLRTPVVSTYHGIHQGKEALSLWGERVICVSEDARRHLVAHFGVEPAKTVVIFNGINPASFRGLHAPLNSGSRSGNGKSPCLTNVAQLIAVKGQQTLLNAMPYILARHPQARLKLVGRGPMEAELRRMASDLKIAAAVEFLGELADVRPVLAETDVFVMASVSEGMPMALLEALAAGVPAVATAVGGIPQILRHRETGCLVPVGDADRLATEIDFVLTHPLEKARMQRQGCTLVEREFSTEIMAGRTESVYREVIHQWKGR